MTADEFGLLVRLLAAVVWTGLLIEFAMGRHFGQSLIRRMLYLGTTTAVLWSLVLRGATLVGIIPTEATTPIITAVVFAAFVVGVALLTTRPVA